MKSEGEVRARLEALRRLNAKYGGLTVDESNEAWKLQEQLRKRGGGGGG